ncbi:MAG TPA: glycosyltransferase family 4 protein [Candidatus Acidoferrales bacterium]|nr:glycosyltransferase family 4 protein [Candidatus Acidoferrales bacterium]
MTSSRSSSRTRSVLFLTAGDPRRLTGGNIYNAYVLRALRRARIRVALVRAGTADVTRALDRGPRVVIVDSIAFAAVGEALDAVRGRVIALAHMRVSGAAARRVLARADRVVAVSAALARDIGVPGVRVITPGSDRVPRVRRRSRDGRLRVLCVANWSRAKGIDVLARAVARMDGVRLELVGDAQDAAYARAVRHALAGVDGAIVIRGPLRGAALARAYADADVVAVPSRSEGYGMAASEAIAHGTPVIASDLPALRAIVGRAGLLIPPSNVRALARALERVADPRLRRRLAARARDRARSLPRWRDAEREFVALVEEEMQRARIGGDHMPLRGVKSRKRTRQYEHIKRSEMKRGRSTKVAKRIAAATTNKTRRKKGETKSRSRKKS